VKDATDKVRAFHVAMGQPTADRPQMLTVERVRLRLALILEEVSELADALGSSGYTVRRIETVIEWLGRDEFKRAQNLTEAADALADISYVVAGTAVEMGIPLGEVFDEVHASNMTKLGGTVREDGKLLKPPGYRPPDIARVLAALEIRREAELARARAIGRQAAEPTTGPFSDVGFTFTPVNYDAHGRVDTTVPYVDPLVQYLSSGPADDEPDDCPPVVRAHAIGDQVEISHHGVTRIGKVVGLDAVAVDIGEVVAVEPGKARRLA
jgi:predicted HAD superfamily Cof-like phosphohydrolase